MIATRTWDRHAHAMECAGKVPPKRDGDGALALLMGGGPWTPLATSIQSGVAASLCRRTPQGLRSGPALWHRLTVKNQCPRRAALARQLHCRANPRALTVTPRTSAVQLHTLWVRQLLHVGRCGSEGGGQQLPNQRRAEAERPSSRAPRANSLCPWGREDYRTLNAE